MENPILKNEKIKKMYLSLVKVYVEASVYPEANDKLIKEIEYIRKWLLTEATEEEKEITFLYFLTGDGWASTVIPNEVLDKMNVTSPDDCWRVANILIDDDSGIMNQDLTTIGGVKQVDNDNYEEVMEKVAKAYRPSNEDLKETDKEEKVEEMKTSTEEKVNTEEVKEETTQEQPTKKSNAKWWCLGAVAVAAVAGAAVYAYNKFQDKDIVIISDDDL